jgi:uncharacterized protein (TIGR02117 family)
MAGFEFYAINIACANMKRILRILIKCGIFLSILIGLYMVCYLVVPCFRNGCSAYLSHEPYCKIYLLQSGVHTDLVVPIHTEVVHWDQIFDQNKFDRSEELNHLAIGWGHKAFYMETPTWADLTIKNVCAATFGFGSTALHVRNIAAPMPNQVYRELELTQSQYRCLTEYILATATIKQSNAVVIEQLVQDYDRYYEANGRYHALRTCNTWIADALMAARQPGPIWTASTAGLFD